MDAWCVGSERSWKPHDIWAKMSQWHRESVFRFISCNDDFKRSVIKGDVFWVFPSELACCPVSYAARNGMGRGQYATVLKRGSHKNCEALRFLAENAPTPCCSVLGPSGKQPRWTVVLSSLKAVRQPDAPGKDTGLPVARGSKAPASRSRPQPLRILAVTLGTVPSLLGEACPGVLRALAGHTHPPSRKDPA